MTYLEKLEQDHPGWSRAKLVGVAQTFCPCDWGYERDPRAIDDCPSDIDDSCVVCWNREITETATARSAAPSLSDPVSHPAHYTAGGIECIAAIEAALACQQDSVSAFLTGQVIKYLWRWPLKGGVEDIKKALWYLSRLEEREARRNV